MVSRQLGRLTAKAMQAARPAVMRERATAFARLVKESYQQGRDGEPDPADEQRVVDEVADAMAGVDWAAVKQATADRTAAATRTMRDMASQVDWDRVQPVAATVSSALLAAVASGQIPLGGVLGGRVVRTILNDRDLAQRVATSLQRTPASMPPDFRPVIKGAIEATSRET